MAEDVDEIIQDKKEDDLHVEEVTNNIEENDDFEIIPENQNAANGKNSSTKEKTELDAELESDTS